MTVENASQYPKVFYCRHMQPGTARYENETILVDSDGMKNLLSSVGKRSIPVYVNHQNVDLKNIKQQADGYVTDAFYNEMDGWGWFKFIAVDDEAHNAIKRGWSVSNAYLPTQWGPGGTKNNVPYHREVKNGEFTHLAIVPDPRYEGAMILTPEEFKNYQEDQRKKLLELQNSKEQKPMFKLFKNERKEVENVDLDTCIELENGKTLSIREMVEAVVENSKKKEQMVKVGDKEISVSELMAAYTEIENAKKKKSKKNEKEEEEKGEDVEGDEKEEGDDELGKDNKKNKKKTKKNEKEEEDCENEMEEEWEEKGNKKEKKNAITDTEKNPKFFEEMRNAHLKNASALPQPLIRLQVDGLKRGQERYGSATK